jgi:hypothetical protein
MKIVFSNKRALDYDWLQFHRMFSVVYYRRVNKHHLTKHEESVR